MVAQINRPSKTRELSALPPTMSLAQGSLQLFIAPRSQYGDVLASAVRTAGQGSEVLVVQLFQGGTQAMIKLCQHLTWLRCVCDRFLDKPEIVLSDSEITNIKSLWQTVEQAMHTGDYRLVVVEGLDLAIQHGLVTEAEVIARLSDRPLSVDIVLVGESMPASILEIADQITRCRNLPLSEN
jgi:ATP:corrinoid adenosyltransferase